MTDKKISELTSLTGANVSDANDVVAIVDSDQNTTKKITRAEFFKNVSSVDINGGTIDGVTIGGASAGAATFTDVTASGTINLSGATVSNGGSVTTVDINGGTIDGTVIGGASAAAGTFTSADLAAIAETKAVTAVDVFVYDTSKDSDGGAWRKRTQHTSWYNETLNTATRGSRREFPAVAVIVAESNKVTIYDGDDPALPMWMVFNGVSSGDMLNSGAGNTTSITSLNGTIVWGAVSDAHILYLLLDKKIHIQNVNTFQNNGDISQRNNNSGYTQISSSNAIVNRTVNDVAMTVLPDAPIDPATGLPVPTIAVATDGGLSVITDSGAVYDATPKGHAWWSVAFREEDNAIVGTRFANGRAYIITIYNTPFTADRTDYDEQYNWVGDGTADDGHWIGSVPSTPNVVRVANDGKSFRTAEHGFFQFAPNPNTPSDWLNAQATSSFNTGWMPGDIKLAALSDTDDTDLVGYTAIDDDGSSATGWSDARSNGAVISTGGRIRSTVTVVGAYGPVKALTGLVVGKQYSYSIDVFTAGGTGVFYPRVDTISSLNGDYTLYVNRGVSTDGTVSGYFTAGETTMYIGVIHVAAAGGDYVEIDNISVKLADADRSVNNNGLIVNGTVTRTAVATGADLVAYSGFSASNYLEQPYNSDLDFGTGDFAIMGWLKQAANTAVETILERDSAVSAQRFTLAVNASGFLTFTCDDDTTARTATSNRVVDNDVWTHFVALYDGAGDVKIYLNGVLDDTETGSALLTLNNASAVLRVGLAVDDAEPLANADLALLRISATVPSDSQIAKIYEDEKVLFQENAQATLYGSSDAVTALAHDPVTDLLHVGTSAGRSVFSGLRRVSNTTTAVGTAISAQAGLVVEE